MSDNPVADAINSPEALAFSVEYRRRQERIDFRLEGEELRRIQAFENEHDAKHGLYAGAIGGRYTFAFTPTSVGVAVTVSCSCGGKLNATEYGDW